MPFVEDAQVFYLNNKDERPGQAVDAISYKGFDMDYDASNKVTYNGLIKTLNEVKKTLYRKRTAT